MNAPTRVASIDDERVALYRLTADHRALGARGLFVAEGRLVVARLLTSPRFPIQSILLTGPAFDSLEPALAAHPPSAPVYIVDQSAIDGLAGFNIHRGCLALAARPAPSILAPDHVRSARRIIALERVSNPDNVGGIFRSAAALGADLVVLGPDCGDPLYRKSVRTSMGAVLELPFVDAGPWPRALRGLREGGVTIVALTPRTHAASIREMSAEGPTALLVGHEGEGLTDAALGEASLVARIPMAAGVDSLNAAAAASIAMYQLWRPGA